MDTWRPWLPLYVRRGNPLRRRPAGIERLGGSALLALIALTVVAVCLVTLRSYAAARTEARQQQSASHQVTATVLGPQAANLDDGTVTGSPAGYPMRLRWTWRGHSRTGGQTLYRDAAPGSRTRLWVDAAGRPTGPPLSAVDAVMVAVGVALGGAMLALLLSVAAVRAFRAWLLRRRSLLWEEEWARIGPVWSRHQDFP
jgi:hypothetical protein